MSPEQVRMEALTHQTDIYFARVTMYRLLTGRLPYQASTQAALTYAILNVVPPSSGDPASRPAAAARRDRDQGDQQGSEGALKSWLDFGKDLSQAFVSLRLAGSRSPSRRSSQAARIPVLRGLQRCRAVGNGAHRQLEVGGGGNAVDPRGRGGRRFYLLVDGEVKVTLSGKPLATLKPGACSARSSTSPSAPSAHDHRDTAATRPSSSSGPARCAPPPMPARSASTRAACACWSTAWRRPTSGSPGPRNAATPGSRDSSGREL